MRYHALACDYDGTLALHGQVDEPTRAALTRLRHSGRRLIMVTGRQLDDLFHVFPHVQLFDRIVAENGALVFDPLSREEVLLGAPAPEPLVHALRERGVEPLSTGRVILATWEPHQTAVLEAIRDLGLEHQVIFNKGAVMVLPSGVNKAVGLELALRQLGLSPHNVVSVGDAENDHAFLSRSECAVAVANALAGLKEQADVVTAGDHGAGVSELIERILATDLRELEPALHRHDIPLGHRDDGQAVCLHPYGSALLLAGSSGSGKSTLALALFERLAERGYQFCIVDPEGDYQHVEDVVKLGSSKTVPEIEQITQLLADPAHNVAVNLLGVPLAQRPVFFETLASALLSQRVRTGRPHWIVVDEAHHLMPPLPSSEWLPRDLQGVLLITVHPDHLAPAVLAAVDLVLALGKEPESAVAGLSRALGQDPPRMTSPPPSDGQALAWRRGEDTAPFRFTPVAPTGERLRHRRKYAEGELDPDRSFYFRGPGGRLNLRAQNLFLFLQSAEGVDDDTWLFHLRRGDYSRWFREVIKDDALAQAIAQVEQAAELSAQDSRALVRRQVEQRYTSPV